MIMLRQFGYCSDASSLESLPRIPSIAYLLSAVHIVASSGSFFLGRGWRSLPGSHTACNGELLETGKREGIPQSFRGFKPIRLPADC
jgi:hypothetical protein